MNKTRNRRAAGFTLLEVMLVMLILTMLVGVGIFGYSKTQAKAERQTTRLVINDVENAVRNYRRVVRHFPDEDEGLNLLISPPADETQAELWASEGPFYPGGKLPKDAWGNELIYKRTDEDVANTTGIFFRVYSPGPNGEDDGGTGDDIPKWAEED